MRIRKGWAEHYFRDISWRPLVLQLAAKLFWRLQEDFTHMPGALARMHARLCLAGHLLPVVLGLPRWSLQEGRWNSSVGVYGWKLPVLLKARPRTGIKSLLSYSIGQNSPGQPRFKGSHFLVGVVSKNQWPSFCLPQTPNFFSLPLSWCNSSLIYVRGSEIRVNHGSKKGADGKYENLQVVLVDLISTQDSGWPGTYVT